jgi:hypothetical protein
MKRYLLLALAALAFVIVAPSAMAVRVRVVDPVDPQAASFPSGFDCVAGSANNQNFPCLVAQPNQLYTVQFVGCSSLSHALTAAERQGFENGWCLYLNNFSTLTYGSGTFTFTIPTGGSADGTSVLSCDGVPSTVLVLGCSSSPLSAGDSLTLSFTADKGVASNSSFFLLTDFLSAPGNASVTVTAVPEPGALGLFGMGLLGVGLGYGWKKRRQAHGINPAA